MSTTKFNFSDAIAQTFEVSSSSYPDGMFISSIGVFFRSVDQASPVSLEVRTLSGDVPSDIQLPKSRVVLPGNSVQGSPNATVETLFRFDQPLYLQPGKGYCFIINAPSKGYDAWCSRVGDVDINTDQTIPASIEGLNTYMCKAGDNNTWGVVLDQDLKYAIYKADFDTTKTSRIVLNPYKNLNNNTFYSMSKDLPLSKIRTVKNSSVLTIEVGNHGLNSGDSVYIEGIDSGVYNGINSSYINGERKNVTVINSNTISFDIISQTASRTGRINSSNNIPRFNPEKSPIGQKPTVTVVNQYLNEAVPSHATIPSTTTSFTQPEVTTSVSHSGRFRIYTNVVVDEVNLDYKKTSFSKFTSIQNSVKLLKNSTGTAVSNVSIDTTKDYTTLSSPHYVVTPTNVTVNNITNKNCQVTVTLSSTNGDLSPSIDLNGMVLNTKTYSVNNQNDEMSTSIVATSITAGNGYIIKSVGDTDWVSIGADSNTVGESFIATAACSGTGTAYNSTEIISGAGTALAKYKSPIRILPSGRDVLDIYVVGNCPSPAMFDVYIRATNDKISHIDQPWTWLPVYNTPSSNITAFTNSTSSSITNEWYYKYDKNKFFTVFDIKIVMRTTNSSVVPKISGIRTIAKIK